jgi:hypothetical protein
MSILPRTTSCEERKEASFSFHTQSHALLSSHHNPWSLEKVRESGPMSPNKTDEGRVPQIYNTAGFKPGQVRGCLGMKMFPEIKRNQNPKH